MRYIAALALLLSLVTSQHLDTFTNQLPSFTRVAQGAINQMPSSTQVAQGATNQLPSFTQTAQDAISQLDFSGGGSRINVPSIGFGGGPGFNTVDIFREAWETFKRQFGKVYANIDEENYRREVFIENTQKIQNFATDFITGRTSFSQKLNNFADMLHNEFNQVLNGFNRSSIRKTAADGTGPGFQPVETPTTYIPSANVQLPERIDWREVGAVSSVKSQGLCGGCYAFSAAGALEGHNFRKTGQLIELSPQNLIDCTQPYGNDGCMGGLMDPAFQYVKDNPGIDIEATYPYEARVATCRFKPEGVGVISTGFVDIAEGDELGLQAAVATLGPVSAAIDASQNTLQFYADGVYFEPNCKNEVENMNHAILIVGYGIDPDGKEYWLVKNSYGADWGIGGYIKMARNANNHCGIASIASYPLV